MINWKSIEGWGDFTAIHTAVLRQLRPDALVIELGTAHGRGFACLAAVAESLGLKIQAFSIDDYRGHRGLEAEHNPNETFYPRLSRANTERRLQEAGVDLLHYCLIENDTTAMAVHFAPDYVFVDADHNEAGVLRDLKAWLPVVVSGGFIGGHDYDFAEVNRAIHACIPRDKITVYDGGGLLNCWLYRKE